MEEVHRGEESREGEFLLLWLRLLINHNRLIGELFAFLAVNNRSIKTCDFTTFEFSTINKIGQLNLRLSVSRLLGATLIIAVHHSYEKTQDGLFSSCLLNYTSVIL